MPGWPDEFRHFFGDGFLERFFQRQQPERGYEQRGLGTGVIVSAEGHIVTNNHVVRGCDKVTVTLSDKRSFEAEVTGTDAMTDLAVLKIEAEDLFTARFGDSAAMEVGDWVLAVGNPFGLDMTVTVGIVSAKGRSGVGVADYENFLQTDAAINPGNSGGPLVNLRGEVVGINTAIASQTGGNMGIGFAIPSTMARRIFEQIVDGGRVERGWLGVAIQDLDGALARSFGRTSSDGALVGDVVADGPAERGGLRAGDIITRFGNQAIANVNELRNAVANTRPGVRVTVEVFREGETRRLEVAIGKLGDGKHGAAAARPEQTGLDSLGLTIQTLTPEKARSLGYAEAQRGVVVTRVAPGSLAQSLGLKIDDVIVAVGAERVTDVAGFRRLVSAQALERGLRLAVKHGGTQRFVFVQSRR